MQSVPSWLVAVQKGPDAVVSDDELSAMVDGILDLNDEGALDVLNEVLENADLQLIPNPAIEALLRYSYALRNDLSAWESLLGRAEVMQDKSGVMKVLTLDNQTISNHEASDTAQSYP